MGAIILKYKSDKVSSAFYEVDFGGNVKGWLRKRGDKKKRKKGNSVAVSIRFVGKHDFCSILI